MPEINFFPLGNADCCRIDLASGKKVLIDYAAMRDSENDEDLRIDLPTELLKDLEAADRNYYDVVAFTHLDDDHIHGASEFFHLEHARKYQDEQRIKIKELWVPAAAIIEEGVEDETFALRAEARHRLKKGRGIRVFSRPEKLKDWLDAQGISLEARRHLITDAGQLVPGFSLEAEGVEFFVHSPFASRVDGGELLDRNTDALVLQATFVVTEKKTKVILGSDIDYNALSEIVKITRAKNREDRLEWDVFKLPHHCSYLSLGPEKGEDMTEPVPEVKWLLEQKGLPGGIAVSTSWPIPDSDEDKDPPHRQAANYYQEQSAVRKGKFVVTMEHPRKAAPEPLVIVIDGTKARVLQRYGGGAASIITHRAPRAGVNG